MNEGLGELRCRRHFLVPETLLQVPLTRLFSNLPVSYVLHTGLRLPIAGTHPHTYPPRMQGAFPLGDMYGLTADNTIQNLPPGPPPHPLQLFYASCFGQSQHGQQFLTNR